VRDTHSVTRIGLAGGVFQNRVLCEAVERRARAEGFALLLGTRVPVNDAGLAFGQLVESGAG
jgi:hydrogenase maturation protein HypF